MDPPERTDDLRARPRSPGAARSTSTERGHPHGPYPTSLHPGRGRHRRGHRRRPDHRPSDGLGRHLHRVRDDLLHRVAELRRRGLRPARRRQPRRTELDAAQPEQPGGHPHRRAARTARPVRVPQAGRHVRRDRHRPARHRLRHLQPVPARLGLDEPHQLHRISAAADAHLQRPHLGAHGLLGRRPGAVRHRLLLQHQQRGHVPGQLHVRLPVGRLPAGNLLRHSGYAIRLEPNTSTAAFRADATFYRTPGLGDSAWTSFRSYNFPDRYLRHSGYLLRIDPLSASSSAADRQDATFQITS
ncbi:AbfB domain-containing protein [Micromonospora sp. NPDC020750]|uniref:AbfB domain-containing protein n=1 Tax=unclassified Micromonospora TaxID=2617518 RepID=UPI00379AD409